MVEVVCCEVWEEVGVCGIIGKDYIGIYYYVKMLFKGIFVLLEVQVFLMSVEKLLKGFFEQGQCCCGWFVLYVVVSMVEEEGLKQILL